MQRSGGGDGGGGGGKGGGGGENVGYKVVDTTSEQSGTSGQAREQEESSVYGYTGTLAHYKRTVANV